MKGAKSWTINNFDVFNLLNKEPGRLFIEMFLAKSLEDKLQMFVIANS